MEDGTLKPGDLIEHKSELFLKLYSFWFTLSDLPITFKTPLSDIDEEFLSITGIIPKRVRFDDSISPTWTFTVHNMDKFFLWRMAQE